jgi:hypothetical protein
MKYLLIFCSFLCCLFEIIGVEVQRIFDRDSNFVNQSMPADEYIVLPPIDKKDKRFPFDVFIVPNAYYWHHYPNSVIKDEQNRVIEPASGPANDFFSPQMFRNTDINFAHYKNHTLDGNLLLYRASCQYWHVHIERVTQLLLYQKAGIFERFRGQQNYVNKVHCGGSFSQVHTEIMEFYGFTQLLKDWKEVDMNSHKGFGYQITNNYSLITTTTTAAAGYIPIIIAARFMNEKAMENYENHNGRFRPRNHSDLSYFHRRIFIGRDDKEGSRGILNLRAVEEVLKKYDIYYFNPGVDASYAKQMYVFTHAELVIGVSGTGFSTNIAFCHVNNTILLELIPPMPKTNTGAYVATHALNFKYYYPLKIGYNETKPSPEAPFYLNTTKLDDFLFEALAEQRRRT